MPKWKLISYKDSAKNRNIEWNISDELAVELFNTKCYYCDEMGTVRGLCTDKENNVYEYVEINGIDRIDNQKCYQPDNVVACCPTCNFIKCDSKCDDYFKRIKHILSKFLISNKLYNYPLAFPNVYGCSYELYIKSAKKRNKEFNISVDEFDV